MLAALTVAAFALAYAVARFSTPLTMKLADRYGLIDSPESSEHKSHSAATPYMGGLAIVAAILVGGALLIPLAPADISLVPFGSYAATIAIAAGLALIGLIDDARTLPR